MAEKKITKREVIEMMLADNHITNNEMWVAYLQNELELLKKKAENKKATKNQTENIEIKADILQVMANMPPSTATEIMNAVKSTDVEKYVTITNQRVSALLKQLIEDNKVVKSVDKKVSKFALVN
jgi:response regulator RpfG family c-di-GMP phosphodiesterase